MLASPHPGGSEYRPTSAKIITTTMGDVLSKCLRSATSSADEGGSKGEIFRKQKQPNALY